jgi:transcriptional regulator with XRE-family HTH domain
MSRTISRKVARPSLAEEIRSARVRLDLIQDDFARLLEVAPSTVGNWESGRTAPNRRMLTRIRSLDGGAPAPEKKSRRYGEQTIMECHTALDLILDNAASEVVKKLQEFLGKHAAQWRER